MDDGVSRLRLLLAVAVAVISCNRNVSQAFVTVPSPSLSRISTSRTSDSSFWAHPATKGDLDIVISKPPTTIPIADGKSFMDDLVDRVQRNDTSPVTFIGYITTKRSLSKHLVFLDFCTEAGRRNGGDGDNNTYDTTCQALLRREQYAGSHYAGYQKCLHKGTKLVVVGHAAPTGNPGNAVLSVQSIERLLGVPRQVQHLECILREAQSGGLPLDQVSRACEVDEDQLKDLLLKAEMTTAQQRRQSQEKGGLFTSQTKKSPAKPLRDLAKQILNDLNDDPSYPTALVEDRHMVKQEDVYAVREAPLHWQQVPAGVLPTPVANDTAETSSGKVIFERLMDYHAQLSANVGSDSNRQLPHLVSVEGWIQNRRRFQNDITVVVLVEEPTDGDIDGQAIGTRNMDSCDTMRLECILHPSSVSIPVAAVYRNLMAVGGKISVQGNLVYSPELGKMALWATSIRIVHMSSQPAAIHQLLHQLRTGDVAMEEGAKALQLSHPEIEKLTLMSATELKWKANQLAATLQESNQQFSKRLPREILDAMEKYNFISEKYPVTAIHVERSHQEQPNQASAVSSLPVKTIRMPESRWETKKRPQIEWMTQQVQRVLLSHPDFGKRRLRILDIGGGKGLLAHHLARYIDNVQIHVVDICEGAVANGLRKAERTAKTSKSNQSDVKFHMADASSGPDLAGVEADVVVALHACGHLTDVALAHAVQRRAGFVIAPCCFNSNRQLTLPTRSGDKLLVHEWHGVPEHDWAMLKTVAEIQGDIATASKGMNILCGLRAQTVAQKLDERGRAEQQGCVVDILAFPIEFSTRNLVMVGQVPS